MTVLRDETREPGSSQVAAPLLRLVRWFLLTRLALLMVAGVSLWLIPRGPFEVHTQPVEWLNHWDAGWYLSIAQHGYSYDPHIKSNAAFFPLYPMLARGVSAIIPNLLVSGYLISNGFLLADCVLLWKLVVRDYGSRFLADRAVLFLLLCPLTVFYSSFYTESLFLFLALAVAYLAGAGRWLAAGGCGFLAGMTRPPGALLIVLIAVEYVRRLLQRQRDPDRPRIFIPAETLSVLVALLLPPCALIAFAYYLYARFGDSRIMFHVHEQWHQHMITPWNILGSGLIYHAFDMIWLYSALAIGLILAAFGLRYRLRSSHLAMLFTFLLLYCSNSLLEALPRYLSVLFPFYIIAAEICLRHPRFERWFFGISAALAVLSTVLFVDGYWFT